MRETQRDAGRSAAAASIAMLGFQRWCRPPFAFVMQRIDWQRAGFRKVQTTSGRGDKQAPVPSVGIFVA